jgi:hypothetical protein
MYDNWKEQINCMKKSFSEKLLVDQLTIFRENIELEGHYRSQKPSKPEGLCYI